MYPDNWLTEEEKLLRKTVRDLVEREIAPRAAEVDEREEVPWENLKKLAELGLMGLGVDPEYGGSGGGYRQIALAAEEVARGCVSTSVVWLAHLSLGVQTIYQGGTEGQKKKFLPPLCDGSALCAWALTEPQGGSDAQSLRLLAKKQNGGYLLNGQKVFITNGDLAETVVVFATLNPELKARGICAFVVERGTRGFSAVRMHGKMGIRGSTAAQLFFDDVPVPEENRLGPEGEGFKLAMRILDASRIIVGAQCVGIAQCALETAVKYARERTTFGRPLGEHQAIQFTLADMATRVYAARLMVLHAATLKDEGKPHTVEGAMAKVFASETGVWCADRAVQILGGAGYFRPNTAERLYRDARVTPIYEGASEIQRMIIGRNLIKSYFL